MFKSNAASLPSISSRFHKNAKKGGSKNVVSESSTSSSRLLEESSGEYSYLGGSALSNHDVSSLTFSGTNTTGRRCSSIRMSTPTTGSKTGGASSTSNHSNSTSSGTSRHIENELQNTLIRGSESESRNKALRRQSLKMNQLRHSNLGIHGRKQEMDILDRCLKSVSSTKSNSKEGGDLSSSMNELGEMLNQADKELHRLINDSGKTHMETANTTLTTATEEETTATSTTSDNRKNTTSDHHHHRYRREFIFLHGKSGTGKTALVNHTLRQKVTFRYNGIYAYGKFDQPSATAIESNNHNEPYTAVKEVCLEICGYVLSLRNKPGIYGNKLYKDFQSQLLEELDNEQLQLLIRFVPDLTDILMICDDQDSNAMLNHHDLDDVDVKRLRTLTGTVYNNNDGGDDVNHEPDGDRQQQEFAKAQVNYCFRKFIRLVGTFFAPIVLVLDDLQWADDASLDLLQVLITDIENPSGLLIAGLYREKEEASCSDDNGEKKDDAHQATQQTLSLFKMIQELESKRHEYEFNMTDISIQNLNVPDVNRILLDLLFIDEHDKTLELAELCHRRTGGNPYFLLTFCDMLRAEDLLMYDFGKMEWQWDVHEIESSTAATPNVVDIMKKKVTKFITAGTNKDKGELMLLAACLGSHFNLKTMEILMVGMRKNEASAETRANIEGWMKEATEIGFLEFAGSSGNIQWAHDNIQESAISLVTYQELLTTKQTIGKILAKELSEIEKDSSIFVIVDMLNESCVTTLEQFNEQVWLAKLNLQATRKAISLSAFKSAARYAKLGINLLPKDKCKLWTKTRELTIDLFCYYADAMEVLGEHETIEFYCNEIIKQKGLSVTEKLRAFEILARYYSGTERADQAVKVLRMVLEDLGHKFPKNKSIRFAKMIPGLFRMKATLKPLTHENIRTMPLMTDPIHIQTMKLLDRLVFCSYMCTKIELFSLAVFRMIQMTLANGLCEYSAVAFAYFGIILALVSNIPPHVLFLALAVLLCIRTFSQ